MIKSGVSFKNFSKSVRTNGYVLDST